MQELTEKLYILSNELMIRRMIVFKCFIYKLLINDLNSIHRISIVFALISASFEHANFQINTSIFLNPFNVMRNFCKDTRIWCNATRFDRPANNSHLYSINKKGTSCQNTYCKIESKFIFISIQT